MSLTNRTLFPMTFGRDVDYETNPQMTYLDRRTGYVVWLSGEAYSGSIGRWKRDVRDRGAVHAFYAYQEERIEKLAEEFLRENGICSEWR